MKALHTYASLEHFQQHFHSEDTCIQYLFHQKWPDGYSCPNCQHTRCYTIRSRRIPLYECQLCSHQTSLTVSTVMERSRTTLRKWFTAIWFVSRNDKGINAVQLSSLIQVTYKTAWSILHKIRRVISNYDAQSTLDGHIDAALTLYGHSHRYLSSTTISSEQHPFITAISHPSDQHSRMVKMKLVYRELITGRRLQPFAYEQFNTQHSSPNKSRLIPFTSYDQRAQAVPIQNLAKQMSTWLNNTFHGVGVLHLQMYLDEYCYRLNIEAQNISTWRHLSNLCCQVY
ncbi:transposase [Paenibacillus sp. ACRRX]|nr:transposase [Paenibacillus sp. ACRRX]